MMIRVNNGNLKFGAHLRANWSPWFLCCSCLPLLMSCSLMTPNLDHSATSTSTVAVASPSVDPSSTSFHYCAGIPDSSIEAMFSQPIDGRSTSGSDGGVPLVECDIKVGSGDEVQYAAYIRFGRYYGRDPWRMPSVYDAGDYVSDFQVPGVSDANGEVRTSKEGGGAAVIMCGDAFIVTSISPKGKMRGDLKGNLVNLALSITPWACNGEPIPGLNTPLAPATYQPTSNPNADAS